MRKGKWLLFMALMLPLRTSAHRINEYLQAATVKLSNNQVYFDFHLTPGIDIAAAVLKLIDTNGDDSISAAEKAAYITRFGHDVSLVTDGITLPLTPEASSFPEAAAIRKGLGDILLRFTISLPAQHHTHTLTLHNQHLPQIAVYMVNCLVPDNPAIQITGQTRSYNQSLYQLNFTTAGLADSNTTPFAHNDRIALLRTYLYHGISHILTGFDHLLFLAALVLTTASLWQLVKVVTAFTIAHTVTLTLTALQLVHVPQMITEPVIAASIVFIAIQNICRPHQAQGSARLAVAFLFGLFHGLGFATGLTALLHHLPRAALFYAITGFTAGIEAGNQLVLLPLAGMLKWVTAIRQPVLLQKVSVWIKVLSGLIALAGSWYFWQAVTAG